MRSWSHWYHRQQMRRVTQARSAPSLESTTTHLYRCWIGAPLAAVEILLEILIAKLKHEAEALVAVQHVVEPGDISGKAV